MGSRYMWDEYVPVHERRAQALLEMEKRQKKGQKIEPVKIDGRLIAKKFWGKKWCDHLETFADHQNRLPRGRTYARNGSICHLNIQQGIIKAVVSGSSLYEIVVKIKTLDNNKWEKIKKRCSNQIGSVIEILQGKLSDFVMDVVADHKEGLFPDTREMSFSCSCPDSAGLCKHIAAVLYGVGNRLDSSPELLFVLRGVDPSELVRTKLKMDAAVSTDQIESGELADIFGIDFEEAPKQTVSPILSLKKVDKSENIKPAKLKKGSKPLDLDKLTGNDLMKYRLKMGLTATDFSNVLGVTPASIYRWEKNGKALKLQQNSKDALSKLLGEYNG